MTVDELVRDALEAKVAGVELDPHAWERLRADLEAPRRRRWQPLTVVLSAAAVMLVIVAAAVLLGDENNDDGRVVVAPTTTASPLVAEDGVVAAIPADFAARSSTWISADEGWVLGTATCEGGPCLVVARTTDGGATWVRLADPPVDPSAQSEVDGIRLANGSDGWVFGGAVGLLATHDGGQTWSPAGELLPAAVQALETADGHAWALIGPAGDLDSGRTEALRLYRSLVDRDEWEQAPGNVNSGSLNPALLSLAVHGSTAFIIGTVPEPFLFVNRADGSFDNFELPTACPNSPSVAPWSEQELLLVCPIDAAAGSVGKQIFVSRDGGANWEPRSNAPRPGTEITGVAAADGSTFAVAARSGSTFIHMSFDGGETWETPLELPDGGLGVFDLGFTTPEVGLAISGDGQLYRTTDGGHTWAPIPIG